MRLFPFITAVLLLALAPLHAGVIARLERGEHLNVAAMGTSLSSGWNGNDWLRQTCRWLETKYPGQITMMNFAVPGKNSQSPGGGFDQLERALQKSPDVVFIEFAVNDSVAASGTHGPVRQPIPVEKSAANLQQFIDRLRDDARKRGRPVEIILQTMNTADARRPNLADYYQAYREVARKNGLLLIDHYPLWVKLREGSREKWASYMDKAEIHPNHEGAAAITVPEIERALLAEWESEKRSAQPRPEPQK